MLLVASNSSEAGASVCCAAVAWAVRNAGLRVAAATISTAAVPEGNRLTHWVDCMLHINPWVLGLPDSACRMLTFLNEHAKGNDIVLLNGNLGSQQSVQSSYAQASTMVAQVPNLPCILVIDCSTLSTIQCAVSALGEATRRAKHAVGVIFNKVNTDLLDRTAQLQNAMFEAGIHLRLAGLVPSLPCHDSMEAELPELMAKHLDMNSILACFSPIARILSSQQSKGGLFGVGRIISKLIHKGQPDAFNPLVYAVRSSCGPVVIGVAHDAAFQPCFQGDIEALKSAGAVIRTFSPLHDQQIPANCQGIFLGGAAPLTQHAHALSSNHAMRASLQAYCNAGGILLAQSTGLGYLCSSVQLGPYEQELPMVGVFPFKAVLQPDSAVCEPSRVQLSVTHHSWHLLVGGQSHEGNVHDHHQHHQHVKLGHGLLRGFLHTNVQLVEELTHMLGPCMPDNTRSSSSRPARPYPALLAHQPMTEQQQGSHRSHRDNRQHHHYHRSSMDNSASDDAWPVGYTLDNVIATAALWPMAAFPEMVAAWLTACAQTDLDVIHKQMQSMPQLPHDMLTQSPIKQVEQLNKECLQTAYTAVSVDAGSACKTLPSDATSLGECNDATSFEKPKLHVVEDSTCATKTQLQISVADSGSVAESAQCSVTETQLSVSDTASCVVDATHSPTSSSQARLTSLQESHVITSDIQSVNTQQSHCSLAADTRNSLHSPSYTISGYDVLRLQRQGLASSGVLNAKGPLQAAAAATAATAAVLPSTARAVTVQHISTTSTRVVASDHHADGVASGSITAFANNRLSIPDMSQAASHLPVMQQHMRLSADHGVTQSHIITPSRTSLNAPKPPVAPQNSSLQSAGSSSSGLTKSVGMFGSYSTLHHQPWLYSRNTHRSDGIVSLCPGATDIIVALGLTERLVGVTDTCDVPKSLSKLPIVCRSQCATLLAGRSEAGAQPSGISELHIDEDVLRDQQPSLVILPNMNSLPEPHQIALQRALHRSGLSTAQNTTLLANEPQTFSDIFNSMLKLSSSAGSEEAGTMLTDKLQLRLRHVACKAAMSGASDQNVRVLVLTSLQPLTLAGLWVPEVLSLAGAAQVHLTSKQAGRPHRTASFSSVSMSRSTSSATITTPTAALPAQKPLSSDAKPLMLLPLEPGEPNVEVSWQDLLTMAPDVIIVAGQPAAQGIARLAGLPGWWSIPAVCTGSVFIMDEAMLMRPGPKLVDGVEAIGAIVQHVIKQRPSSATSKEQESGPSMPLPIQPAPGTWRTRNSHQHLSAALSLQQDNCHSTEDVSGLILAAGLNQQSGMMKLGKTVLKLTLSGGQRCRSSLILNYMQPWHWESQ